MASLTAEELKQAASSSRRDEDTAPAPIDNYTGHARMPAPGMVIDGGPIVRSTPFHPSPALDAKHIELVDDYEEFKGYLAPALNALSAASEGLKSIDAAWQALRKDTSKTDQQKSLVIAPAAEKKQEQMLRTFSKAQEDLSKAVEMIEQELNAPVISAATASPTNAELRTVLRQMKPDERNALIDKAVREDDALIVNAVLGVHPLITGVDPVRHQLWTRQMRELRKPGLVRRLASTRKAIAVLERSAPIALGQVEQAMRAKFKDVASIKALADDSEQMLAKLRGIAS